MKPWAEHVAREERRHRDGLARLPDDPDSRQRQLARADRDARWALAQGPAASHSPIGRYAACLAELVLGRDAEAAALAEALRHEGDGFPTVTADALLGLATGDAALYAAGLDGTLASFETRTEYLEGVPIADTVLALEALAKPRGMARRPRSRVLPEPRS
jgi:hypothetical protein